MSGKNASFNDKIRPYRQLVEKNRPLVESICKQRGGGLFFAASF
jgi:hypothetical protein